MKPGSFEARKWAYRQTKEGTVVSFLLHPNDLNAEFATAALGTRYMVAFAEIGDDEKPVTPTADKPKRRLSEMPLSQQAALKCSDKSFQDWLQVNDSDKAAKEVRQRCNVTSRSQFDHDPDSADAWKDLVTQFEFETGRMAEMR